MKNSSINPPVAPKISQTYTQHNQTRNDDYAWLRDENWQEVMRDPEVLNPGIRAYLEAENDYTAASMDPNQTEIDIIFEEMKGRIKQDDASVPSPDGPFSYFRRYVTGGQHPLFCRVPREAKENGQEEILLDGDARAEGQAFFKIIQCQHSPDHQRLAWSVDLNGSEIYQIFVMDIASGEILGDPIGNAHGDFEWSADSGSLFYTILDDNHRPCAVLHHQIGAQIHTEIFRETDSGFFVSIGKTDSKRFLLIESHDHVTSEVHILDADINIENVASSQQIIQPRQPGLEYSVNDDGDRLLILTNADGAEDFKIMETSIETPGKEHWQEFIPHQTGHLILDIHLLLNYMVCLVRVGGLPRLIITNLEDNSEHTINFEEEAYHLGLSGGYEYDTTTLRFTYSSPTTPEQVFDYDMVSKQRDLRKEQEVPSGHNPADYKARRLIATGHDGAQIPITLIHKADTPIDGSAPLLLYGYGSYGISRPALFATGLLSLVDRGFIYAIAHIRGGMECGYGWYRDGRTTTKKNTFLDFISCAEYLIENNYTKPKSIAIHGGSAGGMLVGAVLNMRPDLWGAAIADVPFVDVITTMCDETLPLTPPEWPEWGNPITDKTAYDYMLSYSPYDNVSAQDYPPILVTAGLTDPRVTYWEPAKWVAKLRAHKTDDNILCLKTNMDAGHGGAAGRFDRLKETAFAYGFVIKVLGIQK